MLDTKISQTTCMCVCVCVFDRNESVPTELKISVNGIANYLSKNLLKGQEMNRIRVRNCSIDVKQDGLQFVALGKR